jgi:chemotaxis protein MotB
MPSPKKFKKKQEEGQPLWLLSYADLTNQLLVFFVMLYAISGDTLNVAEMRLLLSAFTGLGNYRGGNTLQVGRLAELGHSVMKLPSAERGRSLGRARQTAVSIFAPELKTKKVRVMEDERGLVISLAADSFFGPASAEVRIEEARSVLQKAASLLSSPELSGRKFRIEGHTDNVPTDPRGAYYTNWELSTARATNVLHYLVDFGVDERQFQVAGFADTEPLASNDTPEGRAYNRRVDIVLLSPGHL